MSVALLPLAALNVASHMSTIKALKSQADTYAGDFKALIVDICLQLKL